MKLELVCCTHDRRALLARLLDSLGRCRRPEGVELTVLLVANACSDDTAAWAGGGAAARLARLPLRLLEEPVPGKSHALNRALDEARGEWLVFVDDDHRLPEDFLLRVVDTVRSLPGPALACGRVIPEWDGSEPAWVHDEGPYRIRPHPVPHFEPGGPARWMAPDDPTPGGGNLVAHRAVFEAVGGFRTDLGPVGDGAAGSEDTELVGRALAAGFRLRYEPAMVQYHHVDPARLRLRYVMRKAYARGSSVTRSRTREPGLPAWLLRKAAASAVRLASPDPAARRHHLVRLAWTLGEIRGHLAPATTGRAAPDAGRAAER